MAYFVGRKAEVGLLRQVLASPTSELVALYGRRRVGKTYMVHHVYGGQIVFEFIGVHGVGLDAQLENFALTAQTAFKLDPTVAVVTPKNWMHAFRMLINLMEAKAPPTGRKRVIFLDELPWMDTPKSGFLAAFDHFWNSWASRQHDLVVVICGSAAAWMIQNVVRNKGGLHNRITQRIRLLPFDLHETALFLKAKHVNLTPYDVVQLYMVTGGIPHYLRHIRPGESVAQVVDRLCFTKDGPLKDEFKDLYPALFGHAERHLAVIRCLAGRMDGLTRQDIIQTCGVKTGGALTRVLDELEESGFLTGYVPFGKATKTTVYKLTDEYTLFYLKFMEGGKATGAGTWEKKSTGQSWKTWQGFAFEHICFKHTAQIKKALGISGVYTEVSVWRHKANDNGPGAQVDLLIDRHDHCINLLEIKFHSTEVTLTQADAQALEAKRAVFVAQTRTRKTVFTTLLTTFGVKPNAYALQAVQKQLTMEALLEPA